MRIIWEVIIGQLPAISRSCASNSHDAARRPPEIDPLHSHLRIQSRRHQFQVKTGVFSKGRNKKVEIRIILSTIISMCRLSERLLAVMLILLLGLSPLQSAIAGAAFPDQGEPASQTACMHDGGMMMAGDQSTHDCDQCNSDAGCSNHTCSSSHCFSSVLAMVPAFSYPMNLAVIAGLTAADDGFVSQLCSSLFRPPRA